MDGARAGQAGSTIYGALTAILRVRMHANAGPVTLLNCDNLRHNGDRSRGGLLQFIGLIGDSALLAWVQINSSGRAAAAVRHQPALFEPS